EIAFQAPDGNQNMPVHAIARLDLLQDTGMTCQHQTPGGLALRGQGPVQILPDWPSEFGLTLIGPQYCRIRSDVMECLVEQPGIDAAGQCLGAKAITPLAEGKVVCFSSGGIDARLNRGFQTVLTAGGQDQQTGGHRKKIAAQGAETNGLIAHVSVPTDSDSGPL